MERQRIEEMLALYRKGVAETEEIPRGWIPNDNHPAMKLHAEFEVLIAEHFEELATLALAAMPVVSWRRNPRGGVQNWSGEWHGYHLHLWEHSHQLWRWEGPNGTKGTADSLEAAKAAAEEALRGLIRGTQG